MKPSLGAGFGLATDVELRRRIGTDEHGGQPRYHALGNEWLRVLFDFVTDFLRHAFTIQ